MGRYIPDSREGDTLVVGLQVTDGQDGPIDITGWKIWFTLKKRFEDADAAAVLQLSSVGGEDPHDVPEEGRIFCSGRWPVAGHYYYDLQILRPDGTIHTEIPPVENNDRGRKWRDRVWVVPQVTRATA